MYIFPMLWVQNPDVSKVYLVVIYERFVKIGCWRSNKLGTRIWEEFIINSKCLIIISLHSNHLFTVLLSQLRVYGFINKSALGAEWETNCQQCIHLFILLQYLLILGWFWVILFCLKNVQENFVEFTNCFNISVII